MEDNNYICPECFNTNTQLMDAGIMALGGPHCILCAEKDRKEVHVITWKKFKEMVKEWKEKAAILIRN